MICSRISGKVYTNTFLLKTSTIFHSNQIKLFVYSAFHKIIIVFFNNLFLFISFEANSSFSIFDMFMLRLQTLEQSHSQNLAIRIYANKNQIKSV